MPQVVKNFPLVVSGLKLYHSLSQPAYCAIKKTLQKEDFAQYFNIFNQTRFDEKYSAVWLQNPESVKIRYFHTLYIKQLQKQGSLNTVIFCFEINFLFSWKMVTIPSVHCWNITFYVAQ